MKKNIIAPNFEFISLSPVFTRDITMNDKIFINSPGISCLVEKLIIIFLRKKLVKQKKPLLYNASIKPKINIITAVNINPVKLFFSNKIATKDKITKEINGTSYIIISWVL